MADADSQADKYARARRRFVRIWSLVGAVLLAGAVVYLLGILSTLVATLLWTLVIVFCLRGIVAALERRGLSRMPGTLVAYLVMVAVLLLVGFLLFSPIFGISGQFASLIESIPGYVNDLFAWATAMYEQYSDVFENDAIRSLISDVQGSLAGWASSLAQGSAAGLVTLSTSVANSVMAVGFAFVIAFWILMDLPAIGREATRLIGPKYAEDARFLHYTLTRIMGGYIKGTLLQCTLIGIACGILFAAIGISNPAALGGITGVLNIIPIVGPWLGGAAAALMSVFVSPLAALVALIGTIVIQQVIYTFVSPKIMADSVDVHPALTLLALMGGSAIGGAMGGFTGAIVGMLASIPAVAVLKACFVYYFEKRTHRQLVAQDGVFFKGTPVEGDAPDPMADATSPHPGAFDAAARVLEWCRNLGADKDAGSLPCPRDENAARTSEGDGDNP